MGKILTADDFKGGNIMKSFRKNEIDINGPEDIRRVIVDNFSKGVISSELKDNAINQLDILIKGKKGEGARGGHVIGHTRSGKPIYSDGGHSDYAKFHEDDHYEASHHHARAAETASMEKNAHEHLAYAAKSKNDKDAEKHHTEKAKEAYGRELDHHAASTYHREEAQPNMRDRNAAIHKKVGDIRKK
jgi:hypothetical protein